jgi:hypothetical protein
LKVTQTIVMSDKKAVSATSKRKSSEEEFSDAESDVDAPDPPLDDGPELEAKSAADKVFGFSCVL